MFCRAGDEVKLSEDKRTMFRIPVANYGKFEREIAKLSKRSQKAGGWQIEIFSFGIIEDKDTGKQCYDVFLDAPDVQLDGYRFLARLDHSQETGNIIRMLPNTGIDEMPSIYRTVAPKCDHCQINRLRRDTFVLQKEDDGSFVQLGSSCMSEFFKTDPRAIAKLAEIVGYARETAEAAQREEYTQGDKAPRKLTDLRYIPLEDFLVQCAAARRVHGAYRPGFWKDQSTKMTALRSMYWGVPLETTDADEQMVAAAMTWIESLAARRDAGEHLNQYEHNVLVVGQATVIEGRATGLAASIIGCYDRQNRQPKVEPKPEPININVGDMTGILDLFTRTKTKWPKITISFPETGVIVLSRAGNGGQYPGTINVCSEGGATWYGRIHLDGRFERTRNTRVEMPEGFERALLAFAGDPAGVAAAYGHRSGRCCFCHLPLTDPRSALVGYGATCAKNFVLPYPTIKQINATKKAALAALAA